VKALIVAALREEFGVRWRSHRFGTPGDAKAAASPPHSITGDGPIRAEKGAAEALARENPEALIGIGVAGGIATDLKRGDIIVAKTIVDEQGIPRDCDKRLVNAAIEMGARPVTIATTRTVVLDKSTINAAAVDMESAAWQRAARNIPFAVVRVILDPVSESLPPFLARCAREDGSISRPRVVWYALTHPTAIPQLVGLSRQIKEASRALAAFLPKLLDSVEAIPYDQ